MDQGELRSPTTHMLLRLQQASVKEKKNLIIALKKYIYSQTENN
jgi:hypothetical protein